MNETTDNQPTTAPAKTPAQRLQEVERKVFNPSALDAAQEYLGVVMEVCSQANVDPVFNFDTSEELPDNYGLAILPLTERVEGFGNVTKGLAVAALPDFDTLFATPEGRAWVIKQVTDNMLKQVVAACKVKEGQLNSIPFSIIDFSSTARSSGLAGFNHVSSLYVKALKSKGLKLISKALLRQILASAEFANQQYPRLPQDNWVSVINSMIGQAEKDSVDVSGLRNWLATRDTETVDMGDIDLTDIDAMM